MSQIFFHPLDKIKFAGIYIRSITSRKLFVDCFRSENGIRRLQRPIVRVLDSFIVMSYRDEYNPITELFSLESHEHLWLKSDMTIDTSDVMKNISEGVVSVNDCVAVYRYHSVTLYYFYETSVQVY